jgi:acetyl-CoA C-acetyltransferase
MMNKQQDDPVVITCGKRSPLGGLQGALSSLSAVDIGAKVVKECLSHLPKEAVVDEVLMGCVLPAGLGQAPARQVALGAGLPVSTSTTTVNRICGSGLQTVIFASNALLVGTSKIIVAGGMESMSNSPYLLLKSRTGYRFGHGELVDHTLMDGLEDPYHNRRLMGEFAEDVAQEYSFLRDAQDAYALQSFVRAQKAIEFGAFVDEIIPIAWTSKRGNITFSQDEIPYKSDLERIPALRPSFRVNGTITAASASAIADGAAACVLMRKSTAQILGVRPLARIVAHAGFAHEPRCFITAPIGAIRTVLKRAGWCAEEIDLYELNEAFAVVVMAAIRDLGLDPAKINVNGGACALGHPLGASGTRILVTLLHALQQREAKRGIASLCVGGGEAVAIAIELCE